MEEEHYQEIENEEEEIIGEGEELDEGEIDIDDIGKLKGLILISTLLINFLKILITTLCSKFQTFLTLNIPYRNS